MHPLTSSGLEAATGSAMVSLFVLPTLMSLLAVVVVSFVPLLLVTVAALALVVGVLGVVLDGSEPLGLGVLALFFLYNNVSIIESTKECQNS